MIFLFKIVIALYLRTCHCILILLHLRYKHRKSTWLRERFELSLHFYLIYISKGMEHLDILYCGYIYI